MSGAGAVHQGSRGGAGPDRRELVAFDVSGHNRAFDQQHQPVGKGVGVGDGGGTRSPLEQCAKRLFMFTRDRSRGRIRVQFTGDVDERAAAELRLGEPVAERVEDGQHLVSPLELRHPGLQPRRAGPWT